MRRSAFVVLLGMLLVSGCDTKPLDDDNEKKEEKEKAKLTLNIVETKTFRITNWIEDYTYEYFSVADPEWIKTYKESIRYSNEALSPVPAVGVFNVSGIDNIGSLDEGWRRTRYCEGLWNVVLSYREESVEVVNGLGKVVCRYVRRDGFSRICSFIGYRLRKLISADYQLYEYSPMEEKDVPLELRDKINSAGFFDSHESYKNDKGEDLFVNILQTIDDDYVFDNYNLRNPVTYIPPVAPPSGNGQSGGTSEGGENKRNKEYKYVKSVDAYTVYSDADVDKSTLYIYKGPLGDRASWVYNSNGLELGATEAIRSGSATIDGRSYSHYISSFGVQTYFNY